MRKSCIDRLKYRYPVGNEFVESQQSQQLLPLKDLNADVYWHLLRLAGFRRLKVQVAAKTYFSKSEFSSDKKTETFTTTLFVIYFTFHFGSLITFSKYLICLYMYNNKIWFMHLLQHLHQGHLKLTLCITELFIPLLTYYLNILEFKTTKYELTVLQLSVPRTLRSG